MFSSAEQMTVPENYHHRLEPIFDPHASFLASYAKLQQYKQPLKVLELACGTGRLTSKLLPRLPRGSSLLSTDVSELMMAVAQADNAAPDGVTLDWALLDMNEPLPFPDEHFDMVFCSFGLMFAADKAATLKQVRRVLRAGGAGTSSSTGHFFCSLWSRLAENPFSQIAHEVMVPCFNLPVKNAPSGGAGWRITGSADCYPSEVPFAMSDRAAVQKLFRGGAGFTNVDINDAKTTSVFPNTEQLVQGFLLGTPFKAMFEERHIDLQQLSAQLAALYEKHMKDAQSAKLRGQTASLLVRATK